MDYIMMLPLKRRLEQQCQLVGAFIWFCVRGIQFYFIVFKWYLVVFNHILVERRCQLVVAGASWESADWSRKCHSMEPLPAQHQLGLERKNKRHRHRRPPQGTQQPGRGQTRHLTILTTWILVAFFSCCCCSAAASSCQTEVQGRTILGPATSPPHSLQG